jgi:hypothetical protein
MENKKSINHFAAGAISASVIIIYSLIVYFANLPMRNNATGWIVYLIFILVLAFLVKYYGDSNNNQLSFGNLFAFGFKSTAFAIVLILFFVIISYLMLPDMQERIWQATRQQMEKQNRSDEEIEKAIEMGKKFIWIGLIGGTILIYAILGAIGSLIGAAITKKKPYNPLEQLDMR